MKDKETYSKKQIVIFNGVIDLIKNGDSLYVIKVSDIAKAADVGKGTIYDYFGSKEETIAKALMYYMDIEMKASYKRLVEKENFKDKYYEMLYIIKDSYKSNMFLINSVLTSSGFKEVYKHLADEGCNTNYFFESINEAIIHLLETGRKDGIVTIEEERYYFIMAIRGSLSTFSHYIDKQESYKDISVENAMDTSYKILLNSFK